MSGKYTPGPWKWNKERDCLYTPNGRGIAKGFVIQCEEDEQVGATLEISEADARLIAAAPDLVEALEAAPILSKFHGDRGFNVDGFIVAHDAWRAKARAALTKARGETR